MPLSHFHLRKETDSASENFCVRFEILYSGRVHKPGKTEYICDISIKISC